MSKRSKQDRIATLVEDYTLPELAAEYVDRQDEVTLLTRKVITCGVAASHSNASLSRTGAYGSTWDSPQAEDVRVLRDDRDRLRASLAAAEQRATSAEQALAARHGGEPLALLSELDEAREKLAAAEQARDAALQRAEEAERQRDLREGLLTLYRVKRAVDGGPGRCWEALLHYDAEELLTLAGEKPLPTSDLSHFAILRDMLEAAKDVIANARAALSTPDKKEPTP